MAKKKNIADACDSLRGNEFLWKKDTKIKSWISRIINYKTDFPSGVKTGVSKENLSHEFFGEEFWK
jgi:hypothetical protein